MSSILQRFQLPTENDPVRLICGDALDVLRRLPDGCINAVVTDPPYGIRFQSARRIESERFDVIAGDERPCVEWLADAARVISPGGCLVCFCRWDTAEEFRSAIVDAGLRVGAQLVWDRIIHGLGDLTGRPAPQHDLMWFAVKGRYLLPGKRPTSVYRSQRLSGEQLRHPCEKPASLMRDLVTDFVPAGGLILDPFMGSGTTGEAALATGRRFIGVELDRAHYATTERRINEALGVGGLFAPSRPAMAELW